MTPHRPRVAVTSDRDELMAMCDAAGMEPVHLPCMEISPIEQGIAVARGGGSRASKIILTSSRTVQLVWPDGMPRVPVWAVGAATATAVRAAGGVVSRVGQAGAEALLADLSPVAGRTLYPHALGAEPNLIDQAVELGVECVAIYSTVPRTPSDDPVDAVLFTSPSAVDGWAGARGFGGMLVGAIGPTTASRLRAFGAEPDVIPARPGYQPLVEAMADNLINEKASP